MQPRAPGHLDALPLPSPRQLKHHEREFYGFVHFTTNTFTDKEWGFGDELPGVFNPKAFDAAQIVDSARLAGMRGLILTCKHHDGFCLWPSRWTQHSVSASPFRQGRGDVVREMQRACDSAGLLFGIYLSPWDRNHAGYGSPAYLDYYRRQLRELLTEYGAIFEVWFDGANGGDGFYGGANEHRTIDNRTYYDWSGTWEIVRQLQPEAVMFSDVGPDVRWVGNEAGIAGDPCWYTLNTEGSCPGNADHDKLNRGERDGRTWLIPECNVSIRPGWFYHEAEDNAVRSARNLVDLWFASVGRGTTFLLNLPPDRRGLIPDADRDSLRRFRSHLDRTFTNNLIDLAQVRHVPGHNEYIIFICFAAKQRFNVVELRERIAMGQRIGKWIVEVASDDRAESWRELASVESVGQRRFVRVAATSARQLRLRIVQSCGDPIITGVGIYLEPDLIEQVPSVSGLDRLEVEAIALKPNQLQLDLGQPIAIRGVRYSPAIDRRADRYEIAFSMDGQVWDEPTLCGEFGNIRFNAAPQVVACAVTARYVRFTATRFAMGDGLRHDDLAILGLRAE